MNIVNLNELNIKFADFFNKVLKKNEYKNLQIFLIKLENIMKNSMVEHI